MVVHSLSAVLCCACRHVAAQAVLTAVASTAAGQGRGRGQTRSDTTASQISKRCQLSIHWCILVIRNQSATIHTKQKQYQGGAQLSQAGDDASSSIRSKRKASLLVIG